MREANGFTLFEILIALFIFAIVGTLAAVALHHSIKTHRIVEREDAKILRLEIAFTLMQRDFTQIIDRKIIDSDGNQMPAVYADGSGVVEFTTASFVNPQAISARSRMQRVGYMVKNDKLIRLTWQHLDQAPNVKPLQRVMLSGVTNFSIKFIDDQGRKNTSWPLPKASNQQQQDQQSDLPRAIILIMSLQNQGKVRLVYPIVARGVSDAQQSN